MGKFNDLNGKTFHWLTVIGDAGPNKSKGHCWLCKCKCGKEVIRTTSHLNENVKHSCGCRGWERHHLNGTRFQKKYYDAINRCTRPYHRAYKYYGGRGIKVERNNFEEFMKDMYESYLDHVSKYGEKETTLDRIDSNGNYCKENCRRATWDEQRLNRRNMYEYNGKKIKLCDLAKELGVTPRCVERRAEMGISIEDIIKYYKEHPYKTKVKCKWDELKKYI